MIPTKSIIADAGSASQPIPNTQHLTPNTFSGLRLALLSGLLLFLANPPIGLWPLAWIALAPLIVSVTRAKSLRQAAWRGYLFGWAFLGPTWYWIGLTINAWTQSNIGWIAWFFLTLILAAFYALWGGAAWHLARRTSGGWRILALAAAWVVMEWLRTLGSITMPWAQLSYTQWRFMPLLQMADTTGAYGVSFVLMLMSGGASHGWQNRKEKHSTRYLWAALALTGVLCLYGIARMRQPEIGPALPVAAMQDNHDPFDSHVRLENLMQAFGELSAQAVVTRPLPQLYVWPETTIPDDAINRADLRELLSDLSRQLRAPLLVGTHILLDRKKTSMNSSALFLPDGSLPRHYDKQQLVPFGEFLPYRSYWPAFISDTFQFDRNDVIPGSGSIPLAFQTQTGQSVTLGPFICYESMYPGYARAMTRAGANLLVTQSNDAWFQSRAAQEQHLAAVVLRAVENRRNVVRSTTNGLTALLDSSGRVKAEAPRCQSAFVVGNVTLLEGKTLYTRFGDWFVALCGIMIALAAWGRFEPQRTQREARGKED